MPLQMPFPSPYKTGETLPNSYWVVSFFVQTDIDQNGRMEVVGWADKASRDANLPRIQTYSFELPKDSFPARNKDGKELIQLNGTWVIKSDNPDEQLPSILWRPAYPGYTTFLNSIKVPQELLGAGFRDAEIALAEQILLGLGEFIGATIVS